MNNMVQQVASCSGTAIKMGMVRVGREVNKTAPVVIPGSSYYSSHVQPCSFCTLCTYMKTPESTQHKKACQSQEPTGRKHRRQRAKG